MSSDPIPTDIQLHTRSRELELTYPGGECYRLGCEYLRVYSPSAEVRGHGAGQEVLQTGKLRVAISAIRPVGNYALQLVFDDGHDTGLYSWDYLYQLCVEQEARWQDYLDRMRAAGAQRDPDVQVVKLDL
ncbi:DUF971 domain-containing protein [Seongchinamella sediminis]|uniref:DUF971 domain-containing protein n=1 Tax=Seongchinamella sediminis TaxID=2283635 RepID=A0A3L7E1X1_9GAMM|nr:DUF971 domain-containing protein [Seongchinamella sediminis]RLQ23496.1 DUF971 domain-containing protein [Seongchinamella sediminis]